MQLSHPFEVTPLVVIKPVGYQIFHMDITKFNLLPRGEALPTLRSSDNVDWPMSCHEMLFSGPLPLESSFICSFIHLISIYPGDIWGVLLYRTVLTKDYGLGDFNNRNLLPHSSGGQEPKIKFCWQGWCLLRATRENLFSMPPPQLPVICLPSVAFIFT